jgi:2-C-methyl-D-erythritol 4-phosphate cytidylyltransferase
MTVHVVYPAAGIGKRFGSDIPKQYSEIRNKPILEWTLEVFQQSSLIQRQVIAISADDQLVNSVFKKFSALERASGGLERDQSVLNALRVLSQHASRADWVLVHDIARPCIRKSDIEKLIVHCQSTGRGAVLARPVTDTVKQQLPSGQTKTVDRTTLWTIQTPQCFQLGLLVDALTHCQRLGVVVTDESSAIEAVGLPVDIVEGSADNIKLTHSDDLSLIDHYLTMQGR